MNKLPDLLAETKKIINIPTYSSFTHTLSSHFIIYNLINKNSKNDSKLSKKKMNERRNILSES